MLKVSKQHSNNTLYKVALKLHTINIKLHAIIETIANYSEQREHYDEPIIFSFCDYE